MLSEMGMVAVRYALGFLLQVAPCAVLCLVPFADAFRRPRSRVILNAVLAVAGTCATFVIVNVAFLDRYAEMRIFYANVLFMALLAVLLVLFWREVDAGRSCKVFVFLTAMVYGSLIAIAAYAASTPLGFPSVTDGRIYSFQKLAVFAVLDAVSFPLGLLMMERAVRPWLAAGMGDGWWRRMYVLPAAAVVLIVGLYWLPSQVTPDGAEIALLAAVLVACVMIAGVHCFKLARDLGRAHVAHEGLSGQVSALSRERDDLAGHLAALERAAREPVSGSRSAARDAEEKVVFQTPSATVAFKASDIRYLEVFGHRLVVHLTEGRDEELGFSLSQARELLPADRFVQCHRSFLVNKDAVRSLRRYEITLRDGDVVPVSKQRYREVEEAISSL